MTQADNDGGPGHGDLSHAPPEDLGHAGAVVDKAVEYMLGQDTSPIAVASALLGGAMGLLARSLDDAAIEQILARAIASVRAGELRRMTDRWPPPDDGADA